MFLSLLQCLRVPSQVHTTRFYVHIQCFSHYYNHSTISKNWKYAPLYSQQMLRHPIHSCRVHRNSIRMIWASLHEIVISWNSQNVWYPRPHASSLLWHWLSFTKYITHENSAVSLFMKPINLLVVIVLVCTVSVPFEYDPDFLKSIIQIWSNFEQIQTLTLILALALTLICCHYTGFM